MSLSSLETTIEAAFEARDTISIATKGEVRDAVNEALNLLDSGKARVATRGDDGNWVVHQWLKKAVLLSFRLTDSASQPHAVNVLTERPRFSKKVPTAPAKPARTTLKNHRSGR